MDDFREPLENKENTGEENTGKDNTTSSNASVFASYKKQPKRVRLSSVLIVTVAVCYLLSMTFLLLIKTGYVKVGEDKPDGVDYTSAKYVNNASEQVKALLGEDSAAHIKNLVNNAGLADIAQA